MRTGNPDVDRARAHLVRAEKYSAIGDDAKAGAHFRRALEYHRRSTKGPQYGNQFGVYDAGLMLNLASGANAATLARAGAALGGLTAGVGGAYLGREVLPKVAEAYGAAGARAYDAAKGAATKLGSYIWPQNGGKEEAYTYSPKVDFTGGLKQAREYGPKEELNYGKQE
jgi:hypothetical protein